jgi:hypothetical protein
MGRRIGRRHLLSGGAAAMLGSSLWSPGAGANFGDLIPTNSPWGPNPIRRPIRRVLEVFLYGGLSPWETFYVVPARSTAPSCPGAACPPSSSSSSDTQWGTFRCEFEGRARGDTRRDPALPITQPFATQTIDGLSQAVHLGPATYPLWRSDLRILDRMQVLVMEHDLTPHEAAIPYALTGTRLGRPTMVGTGAAVSRNANLDVPVSFVVKPDFGFATDNLLTATATGTLGPAHKPLLLDVPCPTGGASGQVGPELSVLDRNPLASPANLSAQDTLLRHYIGQYRDRLTWPGQSNVTRAAAFADYQATSTQFLDQLASIKNLLGGAAGYNRDSVDLIRSFAAAGGELSAEPACLVGNSRCSGTVSQDATRQALNFAGFLLNLPDTRYVCVLDVGEQNENGAGYDTHANHSQVTYRNLSSTLEVLAKMLDPASPSPYKLDPYTMVVITTEFGRTPGREGTGGSGRGHYPYAYTSVIIPPRIDGPDVFLPPTKRIVGAIDASGRPVAPQGSRIAAITPTDLRAALLLGLGVDPLVKATGDETGSIFGVGDLSERMQEQLGIGDQEVAARRNLVREVLGYDT